MLRDLILGIKQVNNDKMCFLNQIRLSFGTLLHVSVVIGYYFCWKDLPAYPDQLFLLKQHFITSQTHSLF
uniref:Uncharacterized protein n=1 Tax=Anguilla anguilla TaxID=7936 RepID=A0A0E9SRU5_ANGAN